MIGWLLAWGLLWAGCDPAAADRYAGLADRFAMQLALASDLAPEARPAAAIDLGAVYADVADAVRRICAASLDAYRTAMPPPRQGPAAPAPGDPGLAPIIAAASRQFELPEPWIQALIRVESAGDASAVSPKGAMGLTQVMPETYAYLSSRYDLGNDPYAPRDNILAGSAYLREMYDRYGPSGFLAAYNAGPGRYGSYLAGGCDLPDETKRYVAAVRLAIGEALFAHPNSRFYEPIAISPRGELLLGETSRPLPVAERLALHSLVTRAVERATGRK